mgnify:CR=1 FL=1
MGLIVIRCDASLRIGSGHVMRCRNLARALKARGAVVLFICRSQPGDLITMLRQEFRVLALQELPEAHPVASDTPTPSGRALYASWLGCSEQQDAFDCLAALDGQQHGIPSWLVVDHYALGTGWQGLMQQGLRQAIGATPSVLVLDDLADRAHQASVLIDANRLDPALPDPYRDRVPLSCTTLLGPAFALLDPLYPRLQPLLPTRSRLNRVLVFFGGVDAEIGRAHV